MARASPARPHPAVRLFPMTAALAAAAVAAAVKADAAAIDELIESNGPLDSASVTALVRHRGEWRSAKEFDRSDAAARRLEAARVVVHDHTDGTTTWHRADSEREERGGAARVRMSACRDSLDTLGFHAHSLR